MKKFICTVLALCTALTISGCGKKKQPVDTNAVVETPPEQAVNTNAVNQLTGVQDLNPDKENVRPVAIMVDNDSNAQTYTQNGVCFADIVYETETEGGITRLMCVYKDIEKIGQIGDVRSARYVYVDLAMGHNAIYVHSGKDPDFCAPHLKDLDNFEIATNTYGQRITYGKAFNWQTLFTTGATLWKGFADKKWNTAGDSKAWQNFASENETVTLSGESAQKATADFNGAYISYFNYNAETGKYLKTSIHSANKNREDGTPYSFKNVFLIKTNMSYYPGNYRRKIDLNSGEGYYLTNGKYEKIKWKKGNSKDPFVFTKADGSTLTVSAGNSWVCIMPTSAKISFE